MAVARLSWRKIFVSCEGPTPLRWDPRPDPLDNCCVLRFRAEPAHRIPHPGISFTAPGCDVHSHTGWHKKSVWYRSRFMASA